MKIRIAVLVLALTASSLLPAQSLPEPDRSSAAPHLYAVEIRAGPSWDHSKKTHEQAFFKDHSANLKRLREQGVLVLGARYSDKGLVLLRAASEQEARAMMQQDPSIRNRVFAYEVHEFDVFYPGSVQARPERP
jgi:uncharacterized protein YciI